MDLLLEETAPKKSKRKGLLALGRSGLSKKAPVSPGPVLGQNLFDEEPERPKAISKKQLATSPSTEFAESPEALLNEYPELKDYVLLSPVTDSELSAAGIKQKIVQSANSNLDFLGTFQVRVVEFLEKTDNRRTEVLQEFKRQRLPDGDAFKIGQWYCLKYDMSIEICDFLKRRALAFQKKVRRLTSLLTIVLRNPQRVEVKLNRAELEAHFQAFREEPTYKRMKSLQKRAIDEISMYKRPKVKSATITALCEQLFNSDMGYFPEHGRAESLFEISVGDGFHIQKRIDMMMVNPSVVGKAILASANEYLKAHDMKDSDLQVYFILFCRLYFARMYTGEIGNIIKTYNYGDYARRVSQLRTLSSVGFGFAENFLDEKYRAMPLNSFPCDNPYKRAVELFEQLPFYTCPIDFCAACHHALQELQNVASEISWSLKERETGKIYAKSDHLLCLDDLRDIALIVYLLGNPVPVAGLVNAFEPYIRGLEMTAELEFAYTNISAMVSHIQSLDIDGFMKEAADRTEKMMDVDPLLGL